MTDKQIISWIQKGGKEKEEATAFFFKTHKRLMSLGNFILLLKDENKREEAYNDSILACVSNIEKNNFKEQSGLKTYLSRIFKNKCIDALRKEIRDQMIFDGVDREISNIMQPLIENENMMRLEKIFKDCIKYQRKKTCEKCSGILFDWAEDYSMKEIADRNQLANPNAAKTQKLKCLKMIKSIKPNQTD